MVYLILSMVNLTPSVVKTLPNNASNAMAVIWYSDISAYLTTFNSVDRDDGGKLATAVYA